jgi:hypothetical protein
MFRAFRILPRLSRLSAGLCAAGLSLSTLACCSGPMTSLDDLVPSTLPPLGVVEPLEIPDPVGLGRYRAPTAVPTDKAAYGGVIQQVGYQEKVEQPAAPAFPLTLCGVLSLAEKGNARIALEREKVNGAEAAAEVACNSCVPNMLRNEAHKRYQADVRLWQQKVELARVTNEVLQDTGNTYVDWLAALKGITIVDQVQDYDRTLLEKQARPRAREDPNAVVLVETLEAALKGEDQARTKLRYEAAAAVAKLLYLLGLHDIQPVPGETALTPLDLVDAAVPTALLVEEAVNRGPVVPEMLGLQAAVQTAVDRASGRLERLERWCCTAVSARLRELQSKQEQVNLALVDLRQKLAAGVREAQSAVLSGRERLRLDQARIRHAVAAYQRSSLRLKENVMGSTISEVMQTIRGLDEAHRAFLADVRDYDRAQVRLLLLLGRGSAGCHATVRAEEAPVAESAPKPSKLPMLP